MMAAKKQQLHIHICHVSLKMGYAKCEPFKKPPFSHHFNIIVMHVMDLFHTRIFLYKIANVFHHNHFYLY